MGSGPTAEFGACADSVGSGGGDVNAVLVGQLAKALRDPSYKVRKNAAQTLGKLGAGAALAAEALVEVAVADVHADVRCRALAALGQVGGETELPSGVVAVLGEVVLSEAVMDTRRVAAVALSRLGVGAAPAADALRAALGEMEAELRLVDAAEAAAKVAAGLVGTASEAPKPKGDRRKPNRPRQLREVIGLVTRTLARLD